MLATAAWLGTWLATAGTLRHVLLASGAVAVGLLVLWWRPALLGVRGTVLLGAAALAVTLTGAFVGHLGAVRAVGNPLTTLAAERAQVRVELLVRTDPVPVPMPTWALEPGEGTSASEVRLRASVVALVEAESRQRLRVGVVVVAPESWGALVPGARVLATAGLESAPWAPVGTPVLATVTSPPTVLQPASGGYAWAEPVRAALRAAVDGLPPGPRGLVPALVDGDESLLPASLRADLRDTGLTHLTAVSGANVAIVVGAVMLMVRACGVPLVPRAALGALSIVGFVLLARPEPSVLRAGAMGGLVVLGLLGAGRRPGLSTLAAATTLLLLLDPWLSRSVGFVLSVLATAGILVLGPRLLRAAQGWMPTALAAGLAVPIAAQVSVLPVLVALGSGVSMAAVPANVLAGLAVAPTTILGLLAGLLGTVVPVLGGLLAVPAGWSAAWIVAVAGWGAQLPGAVAAWPSHALGVLAAAAAAVLLGLALPSVLRSWGLSLGLALSLLLLLVRPGVLTGWPPDGWVVAACDVGQGDALVLRTGPAEAVLVDVGPDPTVLARCLDELGVERLPLVVLTHFHADHVGGLGGLDSRRVGGDVGPLLVSPLAEPTGGAEDVRRWADGRLPVLVADPPRRIRVGPLTLEVLWPERLIDEGSAPNQASVVLLASMAVAGLSDPVRVLLTGDIESAAQRALAARVPALDVDVLKVPHHGSADQDAGFLLSTQPAVAVVSVGTENGYGHPAGSTLDQLAKLGAHVARTDEDGTVVLRANADGTLSVFSAR